MYACILQSCYHFIEASKLHSCEIGVITCVGVSNCMVCKDTCNLYVGHFTYFNDILQGLIEVCIICLETNTSHTCIQFNMTFYNNICCCRCFLQASCMFNPNDCVCDALLAKNFYAACGCIAQNQNGFCDAFVSQAHTFFDVGNAEPVEAACLQLACYKAVTMTIRIRLYNTHNLMLGFHFGFDALDVVIQCIQVNFCPCSFDKIHNFPLPFQEKW